MDMSATQRMSFLTLLSAGLLVASLSAFAQPASSLGTPAATPMTASTIVQPALTDVQRSLTALNIARWKAPGEVRNAAQQNATSIQHDLTDTLPSLLSHADASPGAVPSNFSVYRNIDALYDVLLRVYSTASLAAPQNESDALFASLQRLESARSQLGDAILGASQEREAEVVKLQAAVKAATAQAQAQPAPAKSTVVDDGPTATPAKKKKKPAAKPPASSTAPPPAPTS
jgi:hypothetical protein